MQTHTHYQKQKIGDYRAYQLFLQQCQKQAAEDLADRVTYQKKMDAYRFHLLLREIRQRIIP